MRSFLKRALATAALLSGLTATAAAEPALFVARDADTTIYLFGTIHFAPCDAGDLPAKAGPKRSADAAVVEGEDCLDWMSDAVRDALASTDELWVETVDVVDEALFTELVQDLGYLDEGMLLTDFMPEEELQTVAEMIGGPMAAMLLPELNAMQPWLVSTLIGTTSITSGGASAEAGVDLSLLALAEEQGILLRGFETGEEQVRVLASDPLELQVAGLRTVVVLQDHGIDLAGMTQWTFEKMWDFWIEGDLESLAFLILGDDDAFFDQFDAELAEFFDLDEDEVQELDVEINALFEGLLDPEERTFSAYETIIAERNRNWMPAIRDMLARPGTFFIAVGAGHLTGDAAVQTLIAEEGIGVTRVQ